MVKKAMSITLEAMSGTGKGFVMKKRTVIVLVGGLLISSGMYAAKEPIQRVAEVYAVLHNDAPREQAMDEVLNGSSDVVGMLIDLWSAARIPQRHYVIEYLRSNQPLCDSNWSRVWPVVAQALGSGDLDEREPALMILGRHDSLAAREVAKAMLSDIDPEVRLLALRAVSLRAGEPESWNILTRSLNDPDENVRVFAQARLASDTAHSAPLTPQPRGNPFPLLPSPPLNAVNFSLVDLQNQPMRLSDLRGKTVVVNFWLLGCGPCMSEMPTLTELQKRHPKDLVVLGVNVDGIRDEDAPDSIPADADPTPAVRAKVSELALNFPVAIDRQGTTIGTYDGSGVPLSVLIDADGKIRRRFTGPRSLETWERMLSEIALK
jgi:thiol-disulfide isomerase/thioredoxin